MKKCEMDDEYELTLVQRLAYWPIVIVAAVCGLLMRFVDWICEELT